MAVDDFLRVLQGRVGCDRRGHLGERSEDGPADCCSSGGFLRVCQEYYVQAHSPGDLDTRLLRVGTGM